MDELKKEVVNEEEAIKMITAMNDDKEMANAEQFIADNKIEFEYNETLYRVRLLSLKEKEELHTMRLLKFGELFQDKRMMLESKLIEVYKERGIDIELINDKIRALDAEMKLVKLDLGKALAKNENEVILKNYEEKFNNLKHQQQILSIQKTDLLTPSIEHQLENYVAEYITYLSLDTYIDENWKRTFKTFEEFENFEDDELINRAATRSMLLQYM